MISFDDFIAEDGIPIYLQVVRHIKRGIVAGIVLNGDEVPSRRVLSALLGVNPNTIQKSYAILEGEKLMESRSGAKSYMVLDEESVARVRSQLLENDATTVVNSLKQMGLSKEEALALIENYWE
ncbi:MAG: GntR family transcriptional regulator [Lachnospiraceae bacterium]|nr:GntR family transcriptional regulator [Lachnospiraceae bacterium]